MEPSVLNNSHHGDRTKSVAGQQSFTASTQADSSTEADWKPIPPDRVQSMLGITCALAVVANLGVPHLHAGAALQLLLVVVGFRMAQVIHGAGSLPNWRLPLVLALAARAIPTVLLVVAFAAVHGTVLGDLNRSSRAALVSAATFTSNIVPFVTNASHPSVSHFWAVALVGQVAVASIWLLTVDRRRICARNRTVILLSAAVAVAALRFGWLALSSPAEGSDRIGPRPGGPIAVWTSVDALLLGLALGTAPLATLHRRPTTRVVALAVAALALLLVLPTVDSTMVDLGLRLPVAAGLAGLILAAEAISGLPRWLSQALTNASWHRLGSRSFGLFVWHVPFAHGLTTAEAIAWPGLATFVFIVVLSLAAATTTYRSIELPVQAAVAGLGSRWFPVESMLVPQADPQGGKWVRWDDISLDNLPLPNRRPSRRRQSTSEVGPLGRKLWLSGDRRRIDLRPSAPLVVPTEDLRPNEYRTPTAARSAAKGR